MRNIFNNSMTATATLILLAAIAGPAQAQDAAAGSDETAAGAGDIVVTAQKRAENVQDVPVSIAAFSGESLQSANVMSVQDLGQVATSFSTTKGAVSSALRVSIRGIGAFGNTATEPSVAMFLDGIYVPRAGAIVSSFMDIEGVEVLRGPQGTLFGRNASVGALALHTAAPKNSFSGRITGEVGSYDRYKLDGYVNIPVGENLAFRVAGQGQWFDGMWKNRFDGKTYGAQDDYSFRTSMKADIGAMEWIVRADYTKIKGDGIVNFDFDPASVSPAQLAALQVRLGGQLPDTNLSDRVMNHHATGGLKDRQFGFSSQLSMDAAGGTVRLINSYRDWKSSQMDGDIAFLPLPIGSRDSAFRSKSQNHELQYISPSDEWLGGRLDMVAGLYYYHEDYRIGEDLNLASQYCNALVPVGASRTACNAYLGATGGLGATEQEVLQNSRSFAAYGQLNFKLADALTLVLGGRWTSDRKKGSYEQIVNTPFALALRAAEVLELPNVKDDRFTYRIGLNFKPSDDVMLFGSYSTGYKSGGYNSGGGTPSLTSFAPDGSVLSTKRLFGAETVKNYELGVKSSWLDRALTANLSLYRMDIDGYQDRSYDGTSFVVQNAGSLRHQGFEFDTVIRPTRNFSVNASLAYLDSEFTSFRGGTGLPGLPPGTVQDLTGTRANFTPAWTGAFGASVKGDIGRTGMTWDFNTNVSLTSDYRGSAVTDNNPQTIEDGYVLLGARFTINGRDDRWSISMFGSNLTNKVYSPGSFNQTLGGALGLNNGIFPGSTAIRKLRGDPRTTGVSATVRF